MHLPGHQYERYAKRDLPATELASIDAHVSSCLFCAHALADEAVVATAWERRGWLGRLVRVEGSTASATVAEPDVRAAA